MKIIDRARAAISERGYTHGPNCRAGKHCEDLWCHHNGDCTCFADQEVDAVVAAIEEAIAEEREECAKTAERISLYREEHNAIAKAIRARGNA